MRIVAIKQTSHAEAGGDPAFCCIAA